MPHLTEPTGPMSRKYMVYMVTPSERDRFWMWIDYHFRVKGKENESYDTVRCAGCGRELHLSSDVAEITPWYGFCREEVCSDECLAWALMRWPVVGSEERIG